MQTYLSCVVFLQTSYKLWPQSPFFCVLRTVVDHSQTGALHSLMEYNGENAVMIMLLDRVWRRRRILGPGMSSKIERYNLNLLPQMEMKIEKEKKCCKNIRPAWKRNPGVRGHPSPPNLTFPSLWYILLKKGRENCRVFPLSPPRPTILCWCFIWRTYANLRKFYFFCWLFLFRRL